MPSLNSSRSNMSCKKNSSHGVWWKKYGIQQYHPYIFLPFLHNSAQDISWGIMNIDIFAERVRKISMDKIPESSWDLNPDLLNTVYYMSNSHELMGVNGEACSCMQFIKSHIFTTSHVRIHISATSHVRIRIRYCKSCGLHLNVQWSRRFIW